MPNNFEMPFDPASQPIRDTVYLRVTFDSSGRRIMVTERGTLISLSPAGSIQEVPFTVDHFYSCGHPMSEPPGKKCFECNRVCCSNCSSSCYHCFKPLCLQHVRIWEPAPGQQVRFCQACWKLLRTRRLICRVAKGLLSPFVTFEKH